MIRNPGFSSLMAWTNAMSWKSSSAIGFLVYYNRIYSYVELS
jgi:hypothetical protein